MEEAQPVSSSLQNYWALRRSAAGRSDCFASHLDAYPERYCDFASASSSDLSYKRLYHTLYRFDSCYLSE